MRYCVIEWNGEPNSPFPKFEVRSTKGGVRELQEHQAKVVCDNLCFADAWEKYQELNALVAKTGV